MRPAVVVTTTKDKYSDLILCAISSVLPAKLGSFEMMLSPDRFNNLRVPSIVKIDRIVTLKKEDVITVLGILTDIQTQYFREKFKELAD